MVGIPDVWLTGWIPAAYGRRATPLEVWGPAGTKDMMAHLEKAFAWDIQTRSKEKNKAEDGAKVNAQDIEEGFIYEQDGIKVIAFQVNHATFIDSALGYRIDYAGRSVILSGDTRYSANLVRFAKGADVIIQEVAAAPDKPGKSSALVRQILGFHTSPEEAGRVFKQVKPKLAVYSHIVLLTTDATIPPPTVAELISRTQKVYDGALEMGEDLLTITIGDKVAVTKFASSSKKKVPEAIR